ncbi:MAG: 6-phosphofructokinase [Chloroflexi bacterium]|nr:6-phosphofructokinase [Chloroflexota bacterium]
MVVGQSGGCTAVMNASLLGVIEEASRHRQVDALYGTRWGVQGLLDEELVELSPERLGEFQRLMRTPAAALGTCRYRLRDQDVERLLALFQAHDIRYFLYVGGNDSADTAHRLAVAAQAVGYELVTVHIPKTIDNDLMGTDHCPGYGSAARFLAMSTFDSGRDTEASTKLYPVKIIEVMGRDAGWLTAATGLAKREDRDPPHFIAVPERPLIRKEFVSAIGEAYSRFGFAVAVLPETVRGPDGLPLAAEVGEKDAFGHPRLSAAAQTLARLVEVELGVQTRWDKPGALQRSSTASLSATDLAEAYQVGRAAVRAAVRGQTDHMVALVRHDEPYRCTTGLVPLVEVANREWKLPEEYLPQEWGWVPQSFRAYAEPLLGDPLPAAYRLPLSPVPKRLAPRLSSVGSRS